MSQRNQAANSVAPAQNVQTTGKITPSSKCHNHFIVSRDAAVPVVIPDAPPGSDFQDTTCFSSRHNSSRLEVLES